MSIAIYSVRPSQHINDKTIAHLDGIEQGRRSLKMFLYSFSYFLPVSLWRFTFPHALVPGLVQVDWDGYTIGYYGRIFEARNKAKGGSFEVPLSSFQSTSVKRIRLQVTDNPQKS